MKQHFILLGIFAALLNADTRAFVWTYEYNTMPAGEAEIEHYLTFESQNRDTLEGYITSKHDLEIEIGMNDRFDMGIYQSFQQDPNGILTYSGFKLRGRYRLGVKGKWILDPLIYIEYKGKPDFHEHEIESKLILAKSIDKLTIAVNPVWEMEFDDGKTEIAWKYNAGISYRVSSLVGLGVEFKGGESGHYWGPVISHGGEGLYVALGSGFSYTVVKEGKPELMIRMIMGIGL
ncbi:MAG: hypothetical protein HQ509_03620 [Candidatus Marinimicrobia bacterium]|nr:hypothetical protein [Candidatus Neomarinimicrobiota bacterium]